MNDLVFKHETAIADYLSGMKPPPKYPKTCKGLLQYRAYNQSQLVKLFPVLKLRDLQAFSEMIRGMQHADLEALDGQTL